MLPSVCICIVFVFAQRDHEVTLGSHWQVSTRTFFQWGHHHRVAIRFEDGQLGGGVLSSLIVERRGCLKIERILLLKRLLLHLRLLPSLQVQQLLFLNHFEFF